MASVALALRDRVGFIAIPGAPSGTSPTAAATSPPLTALRDRVGFGATSTAGSTAAAALRDRVGFGAASPVGVTT